MARVVAVTVFEERHERVCVAFLVGSFDEAQVGVETVGIDIGACVSAEVVAAYDEVGREIAFDACVEVPGREGAVVGAGGSKVAAGAYEVYGCGSVFGEEFRVGVQRRLCAFEDADDDGFIVLFPNGCLALQKACIGDGVFAVHHGVGGTVGGEALGIIDEVDELAFAEVCRFFYTGLDCGVCQVRCTRDGENRVTSGGACRDVEVVVLEVIQIGDAISFRVDVERVAFAFGLTDATVKV